jgi:hypothetical protein
MAELAEDGPPLRKILIRVDWSKELKEETLWAKPLGEDLYEVRNSPFCAYGLNWGDVVRCSASAEGGFPEAKEVVSRSGRRTVRVLFLEPDSEDPRTLSKEEVEAFRREVNKHGASIENANSRMVAIDVPPEADYEVLLRWLVEKFDGGELLFEEAWRYGSPTDFLGSTST